MDAGFKVGCRQSFFFMQTLESIPKRERVGKLRHEVAAFLRRSRINAGLKQSEAGAFIRVSRSPISSLEGGEREFGLDEFFTLLQAYNVPIVVGMIHAMLVYQQQTQLSQPDLEMLKLLIFQMRDRGHSLPVKMTGTEYGRPPEPILYSR
jgi:transcriptional regulator with XRE-family HTH domain